MQDIQKQLDKELKKEQSIKSKKMITNKINKSINDLYKELINNIILLYFYKSTNILNFIKLLNKYSIKHFDNELNLEEIDKLKKIYKLLKSSFLKKIKTTKKKEKLKKTKKRKINDKHIILGGEIAPGIKGGPYLQRLVDKGDKPITGNDFKNSLNEITEILDKLRYVEEGQFVKKPNIILQYLKGNDEKLKSYVRYELAPQYFNFNTFPPKINFTKIIGKLSNLGSLISLYNKDKEFKRKYIRQQGLDPDKVMKQEPYDAYISQLSAIDSKYKKLLDNKNKIKGLSIL